MMKAFLGCALSVVLLSGCSQQMVQESGSAGKHFAQHVTTDTFRTEVLRAKEPVVVDFYATWCPPCRQVAPVLESLAKEYDGKLKVVKVDVDQNRELAEQFQIEALPTFYAFKDGKLIEGKRGAMNKRMFQSWFDSLLQREG